MPIIQEITPIYIRPFGYVHPLGFGSFYPDLLTVNRERKDRHKVSGTVKVNGNPAKRNVHILRRADMVLVGSTVSDPTTGYWEIKLITEYPERALMAIAVDDTGVFNSEIFDWITQVATVPLLDLSTMWSPESTDLALWLDGADTASIILDDSSFVSQWNDKSGYDRHAIQTANTTSCPELIKFNNRGAIRFDGTDDFFTLGDLTSLLVGGSVFIVVKIDADYPPESQRTGLWEISPSPQPSHFPWYLDGVIYEAFGTTVRKTCTDPTRLLTEPRIYCIQSISGNYTIWLDGLQFYTTATNVPGFNSAPTLGKSLGAVWLDGLIAEMIIIPGALSVELRQKIEGYLAHKWDITKNLWYFHPYYLNKPEPEIPWNITAKSVIFDFADDWGGSESYMSIRSIEFWLDGAVIPMTSGFTAYATSQYDSNRDPSNVFNTSLSKIDSGAFTSWASAVGNNSEQRLIIVFDSPITFDEIIINNGHHIGGYTDEGVKNTVITSSMDTITDTTYNEPVTIPTVLFDGVIAEHIAENLPDNRRYFGTGTLGIIAKSVIFDFADDWGGSSVYMAIRSIEFWFAGSMIPVTSGFTAYATSQYSTSYIPSYAFNTSLTKIGTWASTTWISGNFSGSSVEQRLIIVFDSPITFDKIVINNAHHNGGYTDEGVKNTVITSSIDAITDTTYNAEITNPTVLFDGVISKHITSDVADDQIYYEWK
jgi:hypothetical protein